MSIFPEQPFDEREERYFLAEILKDSPIPAGNLLRVIQAEGIRPRWTEIALPHGRSVSACQKAFDSLYTRVFQPPLQPLGPAPPLPSPSAKPRKRPVTGGEISMGLNRELQPRGPGFATVNDLPESTAYPLGLADPGDQRKKKRGRPSKAEAEIKAAEYAARGEPYPPPRKSKNPKLSSEGTSTGGPPITFTPVTTGPGAAGGTLSAKKRAAKVRVQTDDSTPNHGPTPDAFQQIQGMGGSAVKTPNAISQTSHTGLLLPGVFPDVQEQTLEGHNVGALHLQHDAQMTPAETYADHEQVSLEHEGENDLMHARGTTQHQSTTEHTSSAATHEHV
ncbi:MAG: hypothetical protein Q9224_001534 [Gallowayella concinna]